ncbi:MAG: hypothetical protein QM681_10300 [Novosphingobium sp.]
MPEPSPATDAPAPAIMSVDTLPAPDSLDGDRRFARERVEMLARFRRDLASHTIVLKDLTPLGARIESVGPLEMDEVITLTLPECRPMIAFVAWTNGTGAGLEFVHPLPGDLFSELVAQYGLSTEDPARA